MRKKLFILTLICMLLICLIPLNVSAKELGTWKHNIKGWWYEYQDKSYAKNTFLTINGKTYYLNADGSMATGIVNIAGVNHLFDANGVMVY